jgi:hypothetical protein
MGPFPFESIDPAGRKIAVGSVRRFHVASKSGVTMLCIV